MATKTFKIGESCAGGIITVQTGTKKVTIIQKEWDYAKGSNRGSDQSGAKELDRVEVNSDDGNAYRELQDFLLDITSSYFTDQVLKFVNSKVTFKNTFSW